MRDTARVLRYTAFTLMAAFGLLGGLFVAGYAFEDLELWAATAVTALWVLPTVGLSVLALRQPATATTVLTWTTAVVALATVADSLLGVVPRDDWGPVLSVVVLALGVTLAFLGLRRARRAGVLMVVLAASQLVATGLGLATDLGGGEGPRMGAMLTTSSGVVVVPVLVAGLLFLAAGSVAHEPLRPPRTPHPV